MARYLSCEGRRLENERIMAGLCAFVRSSTPSNRRRG